LYRFGWKKNSINNSCDARLTCVFVRVLVETLYSGTIAQSSHNFLPEVMSNEDAGEAIKALFG